MERSVREAKARFPEAAAAGGKRVTVTKHGRPFNELLAAQVAASCQAS